MTSFKNSIKFLLFYIVLGGLLALLLLWLFPQLREHSDKSLLRSTLPAPTSYSDAVQKAIPAVVSINVRKPISNSGGNTQLVSDGGSGVIVDPKGYVVTNYHVIRNAYEILIELYDGRVQIANIVGVDPDTDLAVLHVGLENLPHLPLLKRENTRVGDLVFAIGNPYRLGHTVTMGIVSAVRNYSHERDDLELIQTDATINPGNSGGALINANGELIGINSSYFKRGGSGVGISFALASSIVANIVNDLSQFGRVKRGWFGANGLTPPLEMVAEAKLPSQHGVLISHVFEDSPADKAGVKPGDYLTHANDQIIYSVEEFAVKIANSKPGDIIRLSVFREGKNVPLAVELIERPYAAAQVKN